MEKRRAMEHPTQSTQSAQNDEDVQWETFIPTKEEQQEAERKRKELLEKREAEIKKKREEEDRELFNNPDPEMAKIVPLKFIPCSLTSFNGGSSAKKMCNEFIDAIIKNDKSIGLLFTGATGTGKTHLATAVTRELVRRGLSITKRGYLPTWGMSMIHGVLFTTMPELLMEIRATYNVKKKDAPTEEEVVEKYSRCGLLVLDDLGAEKVTDFSITTLYLIIDRRNRELRPTIVTTNLSLQEIGEKIDGRISSRLSEMKIVHLALPDYRKKR